jgi:hypothetical protein
MTDILPIDRDKLVPDEPKELKMEIEPIVEDVLTQEETPEETETNTEVDDDEIFEKPKRKKVFRKDIIAEDPPKKKKRQVSEKQLENLKMAREKSMARRKELKEARDMDAALKKDARMKIKEDARAKKEEGDELILMKAKLKRQAEAEGHWDEERITKLMERTLDSYMEKKKKRKVDTKDYYSSSTSLSSNAYGSSTN